MNRMKRRRLYYRLAAVLLSCFSGTFLLMPVANRVSQRNARIVLVSDGYRRLYAALPGPQDRSQDGREGRKGKKKRNLPGKPGGGNPGYCLCSGSSNIDCMVRAIVHAALWGIRGTLCHDNGFSYAAAIRRLAGQRKKMLQRGYEG